jgi:hypothetical protein
MQISRSNQHGVLRATTTETVAQFGRSNAEIRLAFCEGGLFRYAISVLYSYGGYGGPIREDDPSFSTPDAARMAGLDELLHRWPKPFPSSPASVHDELAAMRHQVESRIRQPSLF